MQKSLDLKRGGKREDKNTSLRVPGEEEIKADASQAHPRQKKDRRFKTKLLERTGESSRKCFGGGKRLCEKRSYGLTWGGSRKVEARAEGLARSRTSQ